MNLKIDDILNQRIKTREKHLMEKVNRILNEKSI